MQGWIALHRNIMNDELYFMERFTKMQAYIDLLLLANHTEKTILVRGIKVKVGRGQTAYSNARLADRWQWSRNTVSKFLNELEKKKLIEQQKSNVTTLISMLNYDDSKKVEQQNVHQIDTRLSNRTCTKLSTNNNDNNDNNENNDKKKEKKHTKKRNVFNLETILSELEYPNEFKDVISTWFLYKNEIKENYKGKMSRQVVVNNLLKFSKNRVNVAEAIINKSIINGWKGFFELKEQEFNSIPYSDVEEKTIPEPPKKSDGGRVHIDLSKAWKK